MPLIFSLEDLALFRDLLFWEFKDELLLDLEEVLCNIADNFLDGISEDIHDSAALVALSVNGCQCVVVNTASC